MPMYVAVAIVLSLFVTLVCVCGGADEQPAPPQISYQAHRGGLKEVPENTLAAVRHAWGCPGAIPEVDVCTTQDGAFVLMHDDTPRRTTTAPEAFKDQPISKIPLETIRQWDAGIKFNAKFTGEKVPMLTEVFEEMKGRPERQVYLDLKDIDLKKLGAMIDEYGVKDQVIFVHGDPAKCLELTTLFPGARTMTWLSGPARTIKQRFQALAETGFKGISQIQLHLKATKTEPAIQFALDSDFLREAAQKARAAGAELQVRPFSIDARSLNHLIGMGIYWYVTDEPARFAEILNGR